MRVAFGAVIVLAFVAIAITLACRGAATERVHIRIRNEGPLDMTDFWLGAGGTGPTPVAYGPIASGQTTAYNSFASELPRYRKCNFIMSDGTKFVDVVYPERHFGTPVLAPGNYTFAYTVRDGEPVLSITRESDHEGS